MSELNEKLYSSIPEDAMVNISVSGKFYTDIKKIFIDMLMEEESKESMGIIMTNLANRKITTVKEFRLFPFFILIQQIEAEAIEQKVTTKAAAPTIIPNDEN